MHESGVRRRAKKRAAHMSKLDAWTIAATIVLLGGLGAEILAFGIQVIVKMLTK